MQRQLNHSGSALNQSSARSRPFRAGFDDASALIKASPIIQQKGDAFRALIITLSFSPDKAGARLNTEEDAFALRSPVLGLSQRKVKAQRPSTMIIELNEGLHSTVQIRELVE